MGGILDTHAHEVDGTTRELELAANPTAAFIAVHAPFAIELERYANAEYQASLSFKPDVCEVRTSPAKAGWAYYWDGWNALVLNFEDRDISPFAVVPVGVLGPGDVASELRESGSSVRVAIG